VYRRVSTIACSNIVPAAAMTVFRREAVAGGLGRLGCRIPGSATRLKDLTADVVPLCQASGVKYPKCDDRNVSEL